MKKIELSRVIQQERPAARKQLRNEKIRQQLTEHVDVKVIPAIEEREDYEKPKLRVCAYCRVSTDMDTQALSYELQVQNYTEYIRSNADWEFAGIYADRGISGTSLKHRDDFNRKLFAPFDAMKGLQEALRIREERHTRVDKREISEDMAERLSRTITKLDRGMKIEVEYYCAFHDVRKRGTVTNIDVTYKKLKLDSEWIWFDDIYSLKIMEYK
ncbi:MAG: YolD-like family protein [Clostridia bacterium]|nr:YolD-like family protein [Clostridia bacterium]